MTIYDISQEVFNCQVFPGDPKPERRVLSSIEKGDLCNLTAFNMCAHNGTHVDAPFHFLNDGKTIDAMPMESFVGWCFLARPFHNEFTKDEEISEAYSLSATEAKAMMAKASSLHCEKRILLAGNVLVTEEAAEVFANAQIYLLGVESQSVGPVQAPKAVHMILLSKEIVLLEGIRLKNLPEGRYFLSAAPLNLSGCDGAPCRAFLLREEEFKQEL